MLPLCILIYFREKNKRWLLYNKHKIYQICQYENLVIRNIFDPPSRDTAFSTNSVKIKTFTSVSHDLELKIYMNGYVLVNFWYLLYKMYELFLEEFIIKIPAKLPAYLLPCYYAGVGPGTGPEEPPCRWPSGPRFPGGHQLGRPRNLGCPRPFLRFLHGVYGPSRGRRRFTIVKKVGHKFNTVSVIQ